MRTARLAAGAILVAVLLPASTRAQQPAEESRAEALFTAA